MRARAINTLGSSRCLGYGDEDDSLMCVEEMTEVSKPSSGLLRHEVRLQPQKPASSSCQDRGIKEDATEKG